MLITRLKPYIDTVSEQLKGKKFGDEVVVGGQIKYVIPPVIPYTNESSQTSSTYGIIALDDSVGTITVLTTHRIHETYGDILRDDEVILVKGQVMILRKIHGITDLGKEYKVIARNIVSLTSVEERSKQDG
jgi:hypothetical protein